jgi:pimeloyl-ACP methyl ester carboxylesterase
MPGQLLAALLPAARRAVVAGAGHVLISTHPADCAALLVRHLERAGTPPAMAGRRPQ